MMKNQTEEFKNIPGYEGHYEVSDIGNVRSIKFDKIKNLKSSITGDLKYGIGYLKYTLCKSGKTRQIMGHRLVASAFLGLDLNECKGKGAKGTLVLHKDDNPKNNHIDNLFLGTNQDNMDDMNAKGRNGSTGKFGKDNPTSKEVKQYDLQGVFIRLWHSLKDIERGIGVGAGSISNVCLGRRQTAGGFIWKYN